MNHFHSFKIEKGIDIGDGMSDLNGAMVRTQFKRKNLPADHILDSISKNLLHMRVS